MSSAISFPKNKVALIVDDDEISTALAEMILSDLGIPVIYTASDGEQALSLLKKLQMGGPDLILCDIFMPNKDGFEFIRSLVTMQYTGDLILASGNDGTMLSIASQVAVKSGLNLLAALVKPLNRQSVGVAIGTLA